MCGRFVAASSPADLAAYFEVDDPGEVAERHPPPRYNVAPTSEIVVVDQPEHVRRLDLMRWGLIPSWAKDRAIGNRMFNARAETVATKASFKTSFAKRRCIIPLDGFYEWKLLADGKRKQPYFIHRPDGEPYAVGGLWSSWRGPDRDGAEGTIRSAAIITVAANAKMSELHDRMPLMLPHAAWAEWLDPTQHDVDRLGRLLVAAPSELIEFHPVSTEVNNARNGGAYLTDEVSPLDD